MTIARKEPAEDAGMFDAGVLEDENVLGESLLAVRGGRLPELRGVGAGEVG